MLRTVTRWGLIAAALIVVGPIAAAIVRPIPAPDGGPGATALVTAAPLVGVVRTLLAVALAGVWGALTARLVGARPAYLVMGIILAYAAWTTASTHRLLLLTHDKSILTRLAIEGALVTLLGAGLFVLIARVARERKSDTPPAHEEAPIALTALGILAGLAAGALAAWFLAQSSYPGQAIAAAALASIALATVARVISHRRAGAMFVAALAVLALAGPVLASTLQGSDLIALTYEGRLLPLARIGPLFWLAGACLGVPIGMAWAESMLERHHTE